MRYRDFAFSSSMLILKKKDNKNNGLEDRCDLEPPCCGKHITIFDGETIHALIIVIIE